MQNRLDYLNIIFVLFFWFGGKYSQIILKNNASNSAPNELLHVLKFYSSTFLMLDLTFLILSRCSVRSIVTLNLPSYGSGRNPWGNLKPEYLEKVLFFLVLGT